MTGKEFLSEYGKLKSCIRSKKEQLLELQDSMVSLKAIRYDKDRVQSSPSRDPMLDGMIKIEEKSNSIAKDITRLTDMRRELRGDRGRHGLQLQDHTQLPRRCPARV